ncbi:hypothetical protein [Jannaschia pohangensis]|uniref:Uncharacterized protein n=1 Tax=Jannaschia pohangensis TaxID=390807 RepID=A0A1I3I881_9RHOB|nr:hypothetical protein [Jannaschia pohangensis]SFI44224.1 hypothetical protein SAMN04488095_0857 [Jannaschia pohangensis]
MGRAIAIPLLYLLAAMGGLGLGSVVQVVADVTLLRDVCGTGLTLAATMAAYLPTVVIVALLSVVPLLILRRTLPHLQALGLAAVCLAVAGFMVHAIKIWLTFRNGCGGVLASSDSWLAGILVLAAGIVHVVVAGRGGRRLWQDVPRG